PGRVAAAAGAEMPGRGRPRPGHWVVAAAAQPRPVAGGAGGGGAHDERAEPDRPERPHRPDRAERPRTDGGATGALLPGVGEGQTSSVIVILNRDQSFVSVGKRRRPRESLAGVFC